MTMPFTCPRTCPLAGERWCRFRPVLDQLGPVRVHSETVRIKVEYRDPDTLRAAVLALSGKWLGPGTHHLFAGNVAGQGFQLPGWQYPCVVAADGQMHYDDYHGLWGNVADLEKLRGEYAVQKAEQAALAQGWLCERSEGTLLIHHPSGGTLTVSPGGIIDAAGFQGGGCHEALLSLGLPLAEAQIKPEFGSVAARIQQPGQ